MSVYKTYTPLKVDTGYRVYSRINDGLYKIYLDEGVKREFTDDTLPNEIKVIVGLINAYDWDKIHAARRGSLELLEDESIIWQFHDHYPSVLLDIGWRYLNRYCLVISPSLFQELRGGLTMSE